MRIGPRICVALFNAGTCEILPATSARHMEPG